MSRTYRRTGEARHACHNYYWYVGREEERINRGLEPDNWAYRRYYVAHGHSSDKAHYHYIKWCKALFYSDKSRNYSGTVPTEFRRVVNQQFRAANRNRFNTMLQSDEFEARRGFVPWKRNVCYNYW